MPVSYWAFPQAECPICVCSDLFTWAFQNFTYWAWAVVLGMSENTDKCIFVGLFRMMGYYVHMEDNYSKESTLIDADGNTILFCSDQVLEPGLVWNDKKNVFLTQLCSVPIIVKNSGGGFQLPFQLFVLLLAVLHVEHWAMCRTKLFFLFPLSVLSCHLPEEHGDTVLAGPWATSWRSSFSV